MNLEEDIKIGYNESLPFEDVIIRIECKDITKGKSIKQQIIQWQKNQEIVDRLKECISYWSVNHIEQMELIHEIKGILDGGEK